MHGARWSWEMRQRYGGMLQHSTTAEPVGIRCAICHLVTPGDRPVRIRVGTDNMAARAAYRRGYHSSSKDINDCLLHLQQQFGGRVVLEHVVHVPGELNPADALSRGVSASAIDGQAAAQSLWQLVGQGPVI